MSVTDEAQLVRRTVREFVDSEVEPVAVEHERSGSYPHELVEEAASAGLLAPRIPEEYGGGGLDLVSILALNEEMYRGAPGLAESLTAVTFGCESILEYGTEDQIRDYVVPATNGDCITAVAMTEPDAGSDFANIRGTAERRGDGYVLNGEKVFISNGTVADAFVVYLRTEETERPHRGITAFLVDADRDGIERTGMDGFLGPSSPDHAQVRFDDVRVPEQARLGEEGRGFYQAMEFLDEQRLKVAVSAVGIAQGALDLTVDYVSERRQFGEPIASKQAVRHRLAELGARVESSRAFVYDLARDVDRGEIEDQSRPAMAKLVATQLAEDVASEAVQLHGGYGCFDEYRVGTYFRATKAPQIYEGSNEILREVIADAVVDE